MKETSIRLIDSAINHLDQMEEAGHKINFESLVLFVRHQIWTKKPIYHNIYFIRAIALISWNSTKKGKKNADRKESNQYSLF